MDRDEERVDKEEEGWRGMKRESRGQVERVVAKGQVDRVAAESR